MSEIINFHQTVGFHFAVEFAGLGQNDKSIDARFQSVAGLDVQFETEAIKEGGENRFEHVVPSRRKYSDLVLKRGLLSPSSASAVTKWCKQAFDGLFLEIVQPIEPIDLVVTLLNENHDVLMMWEVKHAWPTNWKMGELNAERSEVLIETIELNYNYFTFKAP
ncbi:MAG: phage tail protein [Bacteroidota bacterium]